MDWRNKPNQIFNKVKQQMFSKGIESFHYLDQHVIMFDPDATGVLNSHYFNLLLNKVGIFLTTQEIRTLRDRYSKDTDIIVYRDFLEDVKYSVSENISGLLDRAFSTLDHEGTRSVDLNKVISLYDSSKHPHVITRKKYPEDVKQEFINGISRKAKDGRISKEAFIDYYAQLNFCIPRERENYFEQLLTGTWNITCSADYVSPSRITQLEHVLFQKIREKSDGKGSEWKTAKKVLSYFDLDDKGHCDYEQFKRALDKFGCTFKENEMRVLFTKYDLDQSGFLDYTEFSKMIMDIDISGMVKQPNLLTTMGTNHFKLTH